MIQLLPSVDGSSVVYVVVCEDVPIYGDDISSLVRMVGERLSRFGVGDYQVCGGLYKPLESFFVVAAFCDSGLSSSDAERICTYVQELTVVGVVKTTVKSHAEASREFQFTMAYHRWSRFTLINVCSGNRFVEYDNGVLKVDGVRGRQDWQRSAL